MTKPYTYLIGWPELDRWYYGSRYAEGCDPADLWVKYFTSSDTVEQFRKEYGEPTVRIIRQRFQDTDSVRLWEHRVLKRLKVMSSDRWLNKTDNKAIAPMSGELNPMFGKVGELSHRFGAKLPEESKRIIGEKSRLKKGNMPDGFSEKMSKIGKEKWANYSAKRKAEIGENISKATKGRIFTEEHKRNISKNHAIMTGEDNPAYNKAPAKLTETGERLGLISLNDIRWKTGEICGMSAGIKKGLTKRTVCRIEDRKEMVLGYFLKWQRNI